MKLKAWMEEIIEKYGKTTLISDTEPTGHYWFSLGKFLQDNEMRPVHAISYHVKKSKELNDNNLKAFLLSLYTDRHL